MEDVALLVLRLTYGPLVAGHGAQKLFGWFGGLGMQGTRGMMESLGLRPPEVWGLAGAISEFGGGVLTTLGFLNPLGPLGVIGAMGMATVKVHWGKPIWSASGGAELPLTNIAGALALVLAGPGKISLDEVLGTGLPRWVAIPGLAGVAAAIYIGATGNLVPRQPARQAGPEPQAQEQAARAG
jgi:putative oxidoreductase